MKSSLFRSGWILYFEASRKGIWTKVSTTFKEVVPNLLSKRTIWFHLNCGCAVGNAILRNLGDWLKRFSWKWWILLIEAGIKYIQTRVLTLCRFINRLRTRSLLILSGVQFSYSMPGFIINILWQGGCNHHWIDAVQICANEMLVPCGMVRLLHEAYFSVCSNSEQLGQILNNSDCFPLYLLLFPLFPDGLSGGWPYFIFRLMQPEDLYIKPECGVLRLVLLPRLPNKLCGFVYLRKQIWRRICEWNFLVGFSTILVNLSLFSPCNKQECSCVIWKAFFLHR